VSARADGFVARSAVPVEEGQSEVQIGLSRGAVVTGRVVDEQDYPVEGATLEVVGIDFDGMPIAESSTLTEFREDHFAFALPGGIPLVPVGELGVMPVVPAIPAEHGSLVVSRSSPMAEAWVSRADGSFELRPVSPGRVHLVASHPDYVETVTETIRLDAGKQAEMTIVLRQGAWLEGRVVEENGSPVGGARVEIASPEGAIERVTFAADDGSFAFAAVSPNLHVSVARPETPEALVTRLSLKIPAGERAEVEIVLPAQREVVTVSVTDDRGYPLDRVEVHALSLDAEVPLRATRFTDDAGEAVIEDARGLPLRLVLLRSGQAPLVAQVESAPERLGLCMERPLAASGEVRDDVGPVEDATITMLTPTGVRHARSDADGAFEIDNLAASAVRLVHKPGYVPKELRAEIAGEPERPVELGVIELATGGTVEGEVLDPNDEPIAGALVALGRVPTYLPLGPLPLGVSSSDRAGRFVLRDVEPGLVTVEAYVAGMGRAAVERVLVRSDETTREVTIVLEQQEEAPDKPGGGGGLAVTLADTLIRGKRVVYAEHVPQGGEAERAGIDPGDQILAVDGVPVRTIGEARRRLTGPLSEDVLLLLAREPDLRWLTRVPRERLRR
jgi:protocatechuate 3,4-dioxygenase beta subunit